MLLVEKKDGVTRVTLNRPEVRNAFDDALIKLLHEAFLSLGKDDSVRAVVLAGNGPAFCAVAALNWMKRMAGYDYAANQRDAQAQNAGPLPASTTALTESSFPRERNASWRSLMS